ncbi:hypothetical protein, partial [Streptomyces sp. NPDC059371]|uniref:hypothetical protein n=1 Tax=Streptomyces sp. NPDC059371 TaxID=3346812 RepID=UPI0036B78B56
MRMPARQRCHAVLAGLVTLTTAAVLCVAGGAPASAADTWNEVGSDRADPLTESQGLTSVEVPAGSPNHYTGIGTIPASVSGRGWNHVGDPDASYNGYYVEPYQSDSGSAKMFRVQAPGGAWSEYVHKLSAGEALNNSFVTIAPSGTWMVSGEYGTMNRLLVFPTPGVNPATSPSADLPQASTINLDHAVRDVQGCDFVTATRLLCSSDDPAGTLFGMTKPLLQIDLSGGAGGGGPRAGHPPARRGGPPRAAAAGAPGGGGWES